MAQHGTQQAEKRPWRQRFGTFLNRLWCSLLEFFLPWVAKRFCAGADGPEEEYPKKPRSRSLSIVAGTRWILSLGPIFLGAWVSIDGADILNATERLLSHGLQGDVYWSAFWFWIIGLLWTRALYIRLKEEDRSEQRYRADLIRALYSLPNLNVLWQYEGYHQNIAKLTRIDLQSKNLHELGEQIQVALAVIAEMAQEFARQKNAVYGANIMLVINQVDIERLPAEYTNNIRFVDEPINPMGLDGLLVLPKELVLMYLPDGGQSSEAPEEYPLRSYPLITLPIRRGPDALVLPGAPRAVLDSNMSVYEDTRTLADDYCTSFSKPVRDQIRAYFSSNGEGKDVRSFASIRLDSGDNPVGVLNIDSNMPNVLGMDEDYYPTFIALARPLLHLLDPLVCAFAEVWWQEIGNPAPSQENNPIPPPTAHGA